MTTDRSSGLVGHVLDDRYEVVKKLARGGMATVYVAHDLRLSRTVAIKVMNDGLGESDDFAARFDAEARAAAHLTHPNVVSVFDQGNEGGRPYIVMEYVQGFTLRQLITREAPMDPRRVIELIEPVVSALAAAHTAGLIHRDIKPENVLISERGQVKVADFGLARAVTAQTNAATTGLVIGTVSYIAPELVTKGRADARSDVYSVGIVLYEMLTGRKPHTGDTPIQVAWSHVYNQIQPPSLEVSSTWREGRGGIPPYVDALVTTAANKDRPNRPMDAGVLLGHLRAAREALANGVVDDPELVARMRRTEPEVPSTATAALPSQPPGRIGAERRFTPVTPVSPSFDMSADGAPFYSNGPLPYSPSSPHTRTMPAIPAVPASPRSPVGAAGGVGGSGAVAASRSGRPQPRWKRLLAVSAVLAVVGGGLGWGTWYLLEGRWTTTPALVGLTQADAQAAAGQAELSLRFEQEYSEDVPAGQVIRTSPDSGQRVLREGAVVAWISRGPERFPVPKVTGRPLEQAREALASGSLATGTVTEEHHDSVPAGTVISQSVEPDTQAKRNAPVDLVVSLGPAPVDVADFTGKPLTELSAWAKTNKITLKTTEENHDTIAKGSVISQDPASGQLHRGDRMTVVVSQGPAMVAVPTGLRGLGADQAAEKVKAAGLVPELKRLVNGGFGMVLSVQPDEGTMVPRGSTVVIQLV